MAALLAAGVAPATDVGYAVGYVLGLLFPIAVVVALVLLVRRRLGPPRR